MKTFYSRSQALRNQSATDTNNLIPKNAGNICSDAEAERMNNVKLYSVMSRKLSDL